MKDSKITSGEFKGRTIISPKTSKTHPMSTRARLGIFNTIASIIDLKEKTVLDIYAGTGALGFEALSRGAKTAIFIERDNHATSATRKTAEQLGILDRIHIIKQDASNIQLTDYGADLVFIDPPYDKFDTSIITNIISAHLDKTTVVVASHPPLNTLDYITGYLTTKKYSGCEISFFKCEKAHSNKIQNPLNPYSQTSAID